MKDILDLATYPIDRPGSAPYRTLVADCQASLARDGLFNLEGLVRADVIERVAAEVQPLLNTQSFEHKRRHNVYFLKEVPGLSPDHPALRMVETINHTLCGDQLAEGLIARIYEWKPLVDFIADVMGKPQLYVMDDPLARLNVMGYRAGEGLNWHFDRSEFTTTLLIQAPSQGGEFQYRQDLRSADDPNYEGVARLLRGEDPKVRTLPLKAGTLNIFRGKNTLHRVSPPQGERQRIIAVFSYYERPGVTFSREERIGFYGRAA